MPSNFSIQPFTSSPVINRFHPRTPNLGAFIPVVGQIMTPTNNDNEKVSKIINAETQESITNNHIAQDLRDLSTCLHSWSYRKFYSE